MLTEDEIKIEKIKAETSRQWAKVFKTFLEAICFIGLCFIIAQCSIKEQELSNERLKIETQKVYDTPKAVEPVSTGNHQE